MATTTLVSEHFDETRLILCEGKTDRFFFQSFVRERRIAGLQMIAAAEGITGFEARLLAMDGANIEDVNHVLLVVDNDNQPKKNFDLVRTQLRRFGKCGVPRERLVPASKAGWPAITILTLPWTFYRGKMHGASRHGAIETVVLEIMLRHATFVPVEPCLRRFLRCSPARSWPTQKRSKMQLHSLIAATCRTNPLTDPSDMWQRDPFRPMLNDATLDPLEAFLSNFATW